MSLTMLLPLSKLDVRHEAFRTNIGNHWRISVKALVRLGYAFLHRLGVVERSHVHVNRNFSSWQCAWKNAMGNKHVHIGIQQIGTQAVADVIHPLTNGFR